MSSAVSNPTQNPANNPAASEATSYASAAGSNTKPTSSAPIVPSPALPVNGRPNPSPSPVVRGTPIVNGSADHGRTGSVTIPASIANGGPSGAPKNIQFGFSESPAIPHSTPQITGAAPIPIPGAGNNPRIQSPAHSPSPIPQIPQQSGGGQRAPTVPQASVTFGSFPGDNGSHMKQHNPVAMNQSPHVRRDSHSSMQSDNFSHGGPPHRGGFQGQGRGRGNFNAQYNNNMGYPPSRNFSGPGAGRGGMPPYHQGRGGMQQFPNSPQPHRASPATTPAMAHATPTMQPAALAAGGAQPYYPAMNPAIPPYTAHHMQMNPPYMPPMPYAAYPPQPMNPYVPQVTQFPPPTHQGFVPSYAPGQPAAPPMSRNASQVSDRQTSTTPNQAPAIAQGSQQPRSAQAPPAIVSSSSNFTLPKKSAAIVIKDSEGKVVDLKSAIKAPASPAPGIQQSKTPPAIVSTPTPPPKSSTPSHGRTDSTTTTGKSAEQVREEFKKAAAEKLAAEKAAAEKAEAEKKAAEEEAAAKKKAAEEEAKKKAEEEERAKKEAEEKARLEAEKKKAEEEAKAAEEAKKKAEEEAKRKAEEEAKAKEKAEQEAKAAEEKKAEEKAEPASNTEEEDEIERMIREMEEADRRREEEQAAITARKKAEEEERKRKEAELAKLTAEENDRRLREQEAEMERLEEERERRRKENEAKGLKGPSVAELLAKDLSSLKISEDKKESAEKPSEPGSGAGTPASGKSADKTRTKPAALNLAPLKTTPVEAPQPSAALQSLRSARFLPGIEYNIYPPGIMSPNPALNQAVQKKGKIFKYDAQFLLQFQNVFTEQPSVEFHQQIKALLGDTDGSRSASARTPGGSGRQGSRVGSSSAFPPGGAMGQFGSKPLPPGTTSEQRFAMSQSSMGRPPMGAMGGFNRTGTFPMSRTPSSGPGGLPSPRTGSRRGGSKREFNPKTAEDKAAKTMPLTAGQEVKPITISEKGWKPTSIGNKAAQAPLAVLAQGGHLDPEMVQRKVKAALNKMTPDNFDRISDQILTISSQSKNEQDGRTLRQVIQLTFEKATDEAHWASMYAKFCKRMLESMSPEIRDENILDKQGNVVSGGALFRKYLLNRCQEEFERGWKVDLPKPKEGKGGEAELMSDEYYIAAAAKRRGLGLVQFIGELYKLGMLTERIMHECVRKLLEFTGVPDEAEIESLTKLLKTIGANLDSTEKGHAFMEAYFLRINSIIELEGLPSRLKFMLMDLVDLRKANWVSKEANKGPKTLEEVRAEAEAQAAQKAAEAARSTQRGGAPGGRPLGGRGESRNFSSSNNAPNQLGMDDLRRLRGSSSRTSSQNPSFGPTSMFNSRSNSGRRLGGPGGAFGRATEDSNASSRTGTPPTRERESVAHANAFGLLADTGDHPGSPPSAHASPALSKATLDTVAAGDGKKDE